MPVPTKNKIERLARALFPRYGIKDVTNLVATIVKYRNRDGHVKIWRPEGRWAWFAAPGTTAATPALVTLNFPSDFRRNASQARSDLYRQLEDATYDVMSEAEVEAAMTRSPETASAGRAKHEVDEWLTSDGKP